MMFARWRSQQGEAHSDKDVRGSVWKVYGCFGSLNVGRSVPCNDRNPGDISRDLIGSIVLEKNGIGKL